MEDSQVSAIKAAASDPRPRMEADVPKFPFPSPPSPNPSLATLCRQICDIEQFIQKEAFQCHVAYRLSHLTVFICVFHDSPFPILSYCSLVQLVQTSIHSPPC